jgi:hypothetical protein
MELIAPTALIEPDSSFILVLQLLNRLFTQFLERIGALCQQSANSVPSDLDITGNGTAWWNFREKKGSSPRGGGAGIIGAAGGRTDPRI